jgi:thiaminase/transcriptional activator TenA
MRFTDELRDAAASIWTAQQRHPFVRGIGDGTLDHDKFRHYVGQDYLFLIEYARMLALGCARAPRVTDRMRFAELARAVLGDELALHRSYAAEWGIEAAALETGQPTATTRAYCDFLLRTAALADYPELLAALLPCMWGYHEIGVRLAEGSRPANELYARWIDQYANREFGALADWCRELTDAASATGDRRRMTEAFVVSSQYELAFWDASWREELPAAAPGAGSGQAH